MEFHLNVYHFFNKSGRILQRQGTMADVRAWYVRTVKMSAGRLFIPQQGFVLKVVAPIKNVTNKCALRIVHPRYRPPLSPLHFPIFEAFS